MAFAQFFADYLGLFFSELFGASYPGRPDAPKRASARNSDIISYRDDVPTRVYLGGGLAVSIFFFLVWIIISYAQHHAGWTEMFILLGVIGWPLSFTWMHMCLTSRYPEVPYIWCDTQTVSIEQRCRVEWKRVVTIKPILRTSRDGRRYTVGVTLGYIGANGLETLSIRNPRASNDMRTICQDLRERAVAAGAALYPLDHMID
jgi:hypothetical protein